MTGVYGNVRPIDFLDWHVGNNKDGKILFMNNCASCHNPIKDATGPAMVDALKWRDKGTLYTFLTNRNQFGNDRLIKDRQKRFGAKCPEFPNLSRDDVDAIENYSSWRY
jgi:hypothetical protein